MRTVQCIVPRVASIKKANHGRYAVVYNRLLLNYILNHRIVGQQIDFMFLIVINPFNNKIKNCISYLLKVL